ncbi:MAG: hypothetical protein ACLP7Q_20000 [Isosphaeraceae bacterium]
MSRPLPHEYDMRQATELEQQNLRLPFGALTVDQLLVRFWQMAGTASR